MKFMMIKNSHGNTILDLITIKLLKNKQTETLAIAVSQNEIAKTSLQMSQTAERSFTKP